MVLLEYVLIKYFIFSTACCHACRQTFLCIIFDIFCMSWMSIFCLSTFEVFTISKRAHRFTLFLCFLHLEAGHDKPRCGLTMALRWNAQEHRSGRFANESSTDIGYAKASRKQRKTARTVWWETRGRVTVHFSIVQKDYFKMLLVSIQKDDLDSFFTAQYRYISYALASLRTTVKIHERY